MSDLEFTTPADTYKDLFRLVNGGAGLDATLRNISGGNGVPTGIFISNNKVEVNMNDGILRRPVIRDGSSLYINLGDVTSIESPVGTVDIDLESADVFRIGLNSNITNFQLTNVLNGVSATNGRAKSIVLIIEQKTNGTPGWANITWGSDILWPSASIPSITNTLGAIDVFRITYIDDGSTNYWFGEVIGQDMRSS